MNAHEEGFARHFIIPAKSERYLSLLESVKGRLKVRRELDHCDDLEPRYARLLSPQEQASETVYNLLRLRGAPALCYVMSSNAEIDGQELPLLEALEKTIGSGAGTLLSCIPGKLAYFEAENPGERYMLER